MRRLTGALLSFLVLSVPAGAVDGRDFAGHYDLTQVVAGEQGTSVTLLVDVGNVSGADIGGVTFECDGADGRVVASSGPFDMADSTTVRFSLLVSVDQETLSRWSDGHAQLWARFVDGSGEPQRRAVEATRALIESEVLQ